MAWRALAAERLVSWYGRLADGLFRAGSYLTMPRLVGWGAVGVVPAPGSDAPLEWGRDVNGLLLLMTIFSALPHAWDRGYHIRMEVLYSRLSENRRRRADVLAAVAGIIVFGLMAVQGARFVPFMIGTEETGEDLRMQIWPFMTFLSLCALVLVARLFSNPAGVAGRRRHRVHGKSKEGGEEAS